MPPENALPVTACVDRAPGLWRANIRLRYLGVFANDEPLHAFEVTPPGLVA